MRANNVHESIRGRSPQLIVALCRYIHKRMLDHGLECGHVVGLTSLAISCLNILPFVNFATARAKKKEGAQYCSYAKNYDYSSILVHRTMEVKCDVGALRGGAGDTRQVRIMVRGRVTREKRTPSLCQRFKPPIFLFARHFKHLVCSPRTQRKRCWLDVQVRSAHPNHGRPPNFACVIM